MSENELIKKTAEEIKAICSPLYIILVSRKLNFDGELAGFKLLIVVDDSCDTSELECRLYMEIDCDIPYDIVLYKRAEWEKFSNETGTFAWKTHTTGVYIYGEKL